MNATATRLHVYVSGAVIFALNHNENEVEIYSKHNAAFHASTGHKHTGGIGDGPKLNALSLDLTAEYDWTGKHTFTNAPQLVPLGSIIPFYDFVRFRGISTVPPCKRAISAKRAFLFFEHFSA